MKTSQLAQKWARDWPAASSYRLIQGRSAYAFQVEFLDDTGRSLAVRWKVFRTGSSARRFGTQVVAAAIAARLPIGSRVASTPTGNPDDDTGRVLVIDARRPDSVFVGWDSGVSTWTCPGRLTEVDDER
jgi:hypothetical protein